MGSKMATDTSAVREYFRLLIVKFMPCTFGRIPNAGSFIRSSSNINYGISFLDALISKYIEIPHGTQKLETVVLGSSNGTIAVEAVGLDKIRGKLARLERLREISLDIENVSSVNPAGQIKNKCPSKFHIVATSQC